MVISKTTIQLTQIMFDVSDGGGEFPIPQGEIMRNVARIKLGYYPLPSSEGVRIGRLLKFPTEATSVLDPCAGTGAALEQITNAAQVDRYAVELDAERARQAQTAGLKTIQGNLFDVHSKVERFSLLYLNPPYDSEVGLSGNKRMEFLFLRHTCRWLVSGGVLVMVVPHGRLGDRESLLAEAFTDFRVYRLTDPESERFDQVVLFAVRARIKATAFETNRQSLIRAMWMNPLPLLTGDEAPYDVPPSPPAELTYRGLPLDALEDAAIGSTAWGKIRSFLLPKEDVEVGRPITPLHGGHVGLLCTAGLPGPRGVGGDVADPLCVSSRHARVERHLSVGLFKDARRGSGGSYFAQGRELGSRDHAGEHHGRVPASLRRDADADVSGFLVPVCQINHNLAKWPDYG
jgi:tRNA1(Val) A37 N6-methylase TrmN6